jgi:hypothetical protein
MSWTLGLMKTLFEQRYRGLRLIELVGILLALVLMFWLSISKVREGEDIKRMNQLSEKIAQEQSVIHDLKVTVTHLERPRRLEALASKVLNMKTMTLDNEASLDQIVEISGHAPRAAPQVSPSSTDAEKSRFDNLVLPPHTRNLPHTEDKLQNGGQR